MVNYITDWFNAHRRIKELEAQNADLERLLKYAKETCNTHRITINKLNAELNELKARLPPERIVNKIEIRNREIDDLLKALKGT